jgi:hypothetical protein
MVFAENDDVIQAFAPHSAKETLTDRIHPRRTWSDLHDFDIGAFGDSVESCAEPKCTQSTEWTSSVKVYGPSIARERPKGAVHLVSPSRISTCGPFLKGVTSLSCCPVQSSMGARVVRRDQAPFPARQKR